MERNNVNAFMNGYHPNRMEPKGANRTLGKTSYVLSEKGIAFWVDGVLTFDCPVERIRSEPEAGLKALQLLESVLKDKGNYEDKYS